MHVSCQVITPEIKDFLQKLKQKVVVAVVGGSDLVKIKEQMGGESCKFYIFFTFAFIRDHLLANWLLDSREN